MNKKNNDSKKDVTYMAHRKIKTIISLLLTFSFLLLSGCTDRKDKTADEISSKYDVPDENQLIVYTSHKSEVYLPIITEFENRTGIMVEIHAGGTEEMMQQAIDASANSKCDIMFGGGIENYEADKDYFLSYKTKEYNKLDKTYYSSDNKWTPFTELPIVFVYNKKLVSRADAPRTWETLFNKKWKGNIAFADPNNSGTSYTIISTMELILGKDHEEIVTLFYEQLDGKILSSSGDIIPKVSDGSYLVGITLEETAKKYIDQGYDINMIYPIDGTTSIPDGIAMLKNAPHSYNAGLFIDFVTGYDTQEYAMNTFFRRPIRTDIDSDSDLGYAKLVTLDINRSAATKDEFFTLWNSYFDATSTDPAGKERDK